MAPTDPAMWCKTKALRRCLLLCLLVAAVARLAAIQGMLIPIRISGGSMAEGLLGAHFEIACSDCQFPFRCDAEPAPEGADVVCPNCALPQPLAASGRVRAGERVLIDRAAFLFRQARRNDLVAIRTTGDEKRQVVKRVVGLPGEQVAIHHGDLFIDGVLQKKGFAELRRTAVVVYDDAYRPDRADAGPPRWRAHGPTNWQMVQGGFDYVPANPPNAVLKPIDWLVYHHRASYAGPALGSEKPVTDHIAFNQGVSRTTNAVSDLLLSFQLRTFGHDSEIHLSIASGAERFQVTLGSGGRIELLQNGQNITTETLRRAFQDRSTVVEYTLCDRQILLALDGETVLRYSPENWETVTHGGPTPLAIGARGNKVRVRRLLVSRDQYLLHSKWPRAGSPWGTRIKDGSWFLLGDNPAISLDSRDWAEAALASQQIAGRVLRLTGGK